MPAARPSGLARGRPDPVAGLGLALARLEARTGIKLTPAQTLIGADESFVDWCERLGRDEGMKVDGKPFRLDNRPALRPLYEAIPTTREQASGAFLIAMKATQLGLTVWEVLADIYMAAKWEPVNIGMFMPDQSTASFKSEHRFMRIVRSIPPIYRRLTQRRVDADGREEKVGEGNILTRTLGESIFMFLWTSGKVTTESRPMDVVSLDEVQEMSLDQIDKVLARLGDSDVGFTLMLSTANMPDLDIDRWYQLGTQEVWHTGCAKCGKLSDLSDPAGVFPNGSIAYNTGAYPDAPLNEYLWRCPACEAQILDPQEGEYVMRNPAALQEKKRSFLLPRTISPRITPRKMATDWANAKTGDQKKSFYNRTLARPYIDADQLPVTLAHCLAAVEQGRAAGVTWKDSARDTFMGIDQMGGFNCCIVKERLPDGRQAVIHVEAVFDNDPFKRCSAMMSQFGIQTCVVEQLPNVNDARRFANRHPGRVFLAGYANLRDDMLVWGDDLSRSDKRTADEDRSRYTVTLQQYKIMQTALFRVRDGACLFPDPDALEQDVFDGGVPKRIPILRDWVFDHLTKTALVVEQHEDERKLVARVKKVGLDPHMAFANMLCDVAWARVYGTGGFILADAPTPEEENRRAVANLPGLPAHVAAMIATPTNDLTCGGCALFDKAAGLCTERGFLTKATLTACDDFMSDGEED